MNILQNTIVECTYLAMNVTITVPFDVVFIKRILTPTIISHCYRHDDFVCKKSMQFVQNLKIFIFNNNMLGTGDSKNTMENNRNDTSEKGIVKYEFYFRKKEHLT
jgi:hypothetical protein